MPFQVSTMQGFVLLIAFNLPRPSLSTSSRMQSTTTTRVTWSLSTSIVMGTSWRGGTSSLNPTAALGRSSTRLMTTLGKMIKFICIQGFLSQLEKLGSLSDHFFVHLSASLCAWLSRLFFRNAWRYQTEVVIKYSSHLFTMI